MHNPVALLDERLRAAITAALGPELADADPVLRRSAQPRFGDFQANGAMALAKLVGRPPREIAQAIVEHLEVEGLCSAVEVAGPGFVNLTLSAESLSGAAVALLGDDRLGVTRAEARRVVIDYSAPNVAKEMHVGHLRSTILGDALVRVLDFAGHEVVRQNHLGDWGTPFGMLIEHLVDIGEEEAVRELSVGELTTFYKSARDKFDAQPGFADRARQRVVLLQGGDEATLRLWRLLFDASKAYFNTVYDRLGILLTDDDIAAESFYNPRLAAVAAELDEKGLAVVDDGALCVFPPGFTNREAQPLPLIIRYSTGGYGYATTDLAALRYRSLELRADRILYVVGAPQATHLAMIFEVGRMAGWLGSEGPAAEHVQFGSILGQDRKMYKTRSGDSIRLIDLLDEAQERAAAKVAEANPDLDPASRREVATMVGIGAVKYADLSSDRVKDYVFDWDRMLAFDGNTAPYLQYAHARIRSIFRRAATNEPWRHPGGVGDQLVVSEPAERALVLQLLGLDEVVAAVAESLQPHRLCTYLFEVASAFTTFYEQCPVLRAPHADTRASRLALCELTARTLALGLGLLGIEAPDRM